MRTNLKESEYEKRGLHELTDRDLDEIGMNLIAGKMSIWAIRESEVRDVMKMRLQNEEMGLRRLVIALMNRSVKDLENGAPDFATLKQIRKYSVELEKTRKAWSR